MRLRRVWSPNILSNLETFLRTTHTHNHPHKLTHTHTHTHAHPSDNHSIGPIFLSQNNQNHISLRPGSQAIKVYLRKLLDCNSAYSPPNPQPPIDYEFACINMFFYVSNEISTENLQLRQYIFNLDYSSSIVYKRKDVFSMIVHFTIL